MLGFLRAAALFALLSLAGFQAQALGRDLTLQQLEHRSWTNWHFAPDSTVAFMQTPDGWLWLATAAGAYRFDGFSFEPLPWQMRMPATNSSTAMAASDGSVWLGSRFGGVIRTNSRRQVDTFGIDDGFPEGTVHALVEDRRGVVWAATATGLARLEGGRWEIMPHWDFTRSGVFGAFVAQDDTLWLATADRVVAIDPSRSDHRTVLSLTSPTATPKFFAQASDGSVWLSAQGSGVLRVDQPSARQHWFEETTIGQILIDRDGSLWMAGDGLRRLKPTDRGFDMDAREAERRTEVFSRSHGLSGERALALFEDREGNVWVATSAGVDRFAHTVVIRVPLPQGMKSWGHQALVTTEQGSLWVAASGGPALLRYDDGRLTQRFSTPLLTTGTRAADGNIWFGGPQGVGSIEDGRLDLVQLPPEARGSTVLAMTHDRDGALWVSIDGKGIFTLSHGRWTAADRIAPLPSGSALSMATSDAGDLWLGYADARVARIAKGNVTVYSAEQGPRVGAITSLSAVGNSLWIGGDTGLALFDGQRFHRLTPYTCTPFRAISGIVETADGDLWISRGIGISALRAPRQELSAGEVEHRVRCRSLNNLVMYGSPQISGASPPLAQTPDGRLWIAGVEGLRWMYLDRSSNALALPLAQGAPAIRPRAEVLYLSWYKPGTDGEPDTSRYLPNQGEVQQHGPVVDGPPKLPPHTRDVFVVYTAPVTGRLDYVKFRHRLLGSSEHWQYMPLSGDRRAVYTNLGPGKYRFEITTVIDDENPQAQAALDFEILPAFYQTRWFRTLCALLAVIALALLFWLQFRRAAARLRDRLEARVHERERIARDLHDTLLQGIQGLILKIHSIALQMPERTPSRTSLENALEQAQQVVIEGRERVTALRDSHHGDSDMTEDIAKIGKRLAADGATKFQYCIHGNSRPLHPIVREEAFLVVREAMLNAFRHAHASHVATDIFFERTALRITVVDDGRGLPPEILAAGGREGHWGMTGMRERAARIRGTLSIENNQSAGARIELRVPAAVAYRLSVGRSRRRASRRFASEP